MLNNINITFCQYYPNVLSDLILTKEYLIIRNHLIASILKLHLNGSLTLVAYNHLCDHIIILPQEPSPLLEILPSAKLCLLNKIKMV
jgi:hypothetical protein